jgi:small subunit ribosomal protein S1
MDVKERKISLGIKQIEPDPWETLEQKYAVNSHHKGIVRELVPFGAFVELEDGIEGLVHISDLSWTKKVRHPAEVVKKGQEIEVIILGFDRNERRIALGYKQIQESPWDKLESMYAVGTLTQGKVVRLIDKGVIVELPEGVEGFVPNSQLGRDDEGSIRKRLNLDDMLNLAVVEFEKEAKRIVLSAVEARKKMEQSEYKKYMEAKKETEEQAVTEVPQEAAKIVPPTETLLTVEEIIETPTPKKRAPKKKRPPKEKAKTRVEPKTEVTAETPSEPLIEKKAEKPAKKVKKPKPVEKGAPIIAAEAEGLTSPIETEPIKEKSPKKQLAKKKAKSKITNDAITSVEANEKEAESKEISPSAKLEEKTTSIEQK